MICEIIPQWGMMGDDEGDGDDEDDDATGYLPPKSSPSGG